MTTVSQVMTRGVRTLSPGDSVVLAAQAMDELNVVAIPVCDGERLVGMVTDRDIVVRGVAQDCPLASMRLADVMSTHVRWARDDADVDTVLQLMSDAQIRRVPVVDGSDRLVGVLSLGDVAAKADRDAADAGTSLSAISTPAQPDRSGQSQASGPSAEGAEGAGT